MQSEGIQIATLTRLWNAARSLARIRGASAVSGRAAHECSVDAADRGFALGHPMASPDPLLWQAYEFRILDVRPAPAFTARHIPDSGSIPASELTARLFELPPRWRTLVIASDDPAEAERTADELRGRGWLKIVPLIEPVRDWPGPWEQGPSRRTLWEPTPLVRRWSTSIPPGPVCDLGCGAGRDSVHLAMLGHDVTAVDVLPDALKMAQSLAAQMGVSLHTELLNLRRQMPGDGPWSAILMVRFLEQNLFAWVKRTLAPGGLFLFEAFTREQTNHGTPRRCKRTIESQALLGAFHREDDERGFEILEYLETTDLSGDFVARLVARKTGRGDGDDRDR